MGSTQVFAGSCWRNVCLFAQILPRVQPLRDGIWNDKELVAMEQEPQQPPLGGNTESVGQNHLQRDTALLPPLYV